MRNPFLKEAAPVTTTKTPEWERAEHNHYFPIRYLREMAREMALKAPAERQETWKSSAGEHLTMQPEVQSNSNLNIRVSDADAVVAPRMPKPWEVVITAESKSSLVRTSYVQNGIVRYTWNANLSNDGVLEWGDAMLERRAAKDQQTGQSFPYLVHRVPEQDPAAREVAERIRGVVNEVSDRGTELMVIGTRIGLPEIVDLETDGEE